MQHPAFPEEMKIGEIENQPEQKKNIFEINPDSKSSKIVKVYVQNLKKTSSFCFCVSQLDWICTSLFEIFSQLFEMRRTDRRHHTDVNVKTFDYDLSILREYNTKS